MLGNATGGASVPLDPIFTTLDGDIADLVRSMQDKVRAVEEQLRRDHER
jgi:hypothetical protein